MAADTAQTRPDILVFGPPKPVVMSGLAAAYTLHNFENQRDLGRLGSTAACCGR